MGGLSEHLDLTILVIVLACCTYLLPQVFTEVSHPIVSYQEDKTAIDTRGSLYVGDSLKTGADLLMALSVVDEYTPYPKSIKINDTPVIKLDKAWVANRPTNLHMIYSPTEEWKLGNMLNWKITDITYENNNNNPYLHFILEEGA